MRPVRAWLAALILLVFAMVLIGGATRLTESGLSITQWDLVMGALPPLNEADWLRAFQLYQQSPQYDLLNVGMALGDFKTIYWWEWAHRELGRFIGLFYIAGFLVIALRRMATPRVLVALAAMGVLLGAQGVVGWIMVASGLEPGMTAVAPLKLTLHLTLACLFLATLTVAFVRLGGTVRDYAQATTRRLAWTLVVLAFAQVALGGLVAGNDAGLTYNSWPLMDGAFVPRGLWSLDPSWRNFVENLTTIQFNHRIGAYVLTAAVVAYAIATRGESATTRARAVLLVLLVAGQVGLGIATLLTAVPIELAIAHQGMALLLVFVLTWNASVFRRAMFA